jgi:hypothetical protein
MKNIFKQHNFDYFYNRIKNDNHFKHSRINDGEMIAIEGNSTNMPTCDGHLLFKDIGLDLEKILLNYKASDHYFLISAKMWYTQQRYKKILHKYNDQNPELIFVDNDFIRVSHRDNPPDFFKLLELLKTKKLYIIGAERFGKLSKFLNFVHIKIPSNNCYLVKDQVIQTIKDINTTSSDNYYLFSASLSSSVIIDAFKDDIHNTYLDWGSVWDTFFVNVNIYRRSDVARKYNKYKDIYKDYLIYE